MRRIFILISLFPILLIGQENPLEIFKPLEKYIWNAEGKWGDGSMFKQEVSLSFSMNDKIVIVESKGFTNNEKTEFGLRNHGIRQFDEKSKKIRFWEFDVFGTVTKGYVESNDKNLVYQYQYGETFVTEMWIYKNENTYEFIVGIYENGKWTQKFLDTKFIGKEKIK